METNLRQAEAKVNVEGVVSEIELTEELNKELGCNQISGYLTLKTSETNFVKFNVRINAKTKNGTDNRAYPGIVTVMNEYRSIAQYGEDADKVRVAGDLNLYHSDQTGQDVVGYKSNFFNRVTNDYDPHATFDVEMFIQSITPEMNQDGEETGRVCVKGWVPQYENGIEPLNLVAPEDVADAVSNTFEPGQTVRFFGDIINDRVVIKKEIPVAIGKPKIETHTISKNELLITGASEAYEEGISAEAPYPAETIKAAIQERKDRIESRKAMAAAKNAGGKTGNTKPSGAARGRQLDLGF
jgi:hypothetical protein